jgi:Putative transposase
MTLDTSEFIRRFLMHVLPSGFHRIRHVSLKYLTFLNFIWCNPRIGPAPAWRQGRPPARLGRQRG